MYDDMLIYKKCWKNRLSFKIICNALLISGKMHFFGRLKNNGIKHDLYFAFCHCLEPNMAQLLFVKVNALCRLVISNYLFCCFLNSISVDILSCRK